MSTSLVALSAEQLESYHQHGYLLIKGAVREETLARSQRVLSRWVDGMARQWQAEGLIDDLLADEPFGRRLLSLWLAAGKPAYSRSPRTEIVCEEVFEILRAPEFLDISQDLLGTPELSVHSIFNARPKLPDQRWTDTPWHQDAQYFRDAEHTHVPTFWFPLQAVTTQNSCLQVAPDFQRGELHEGYNDPETGFLGLSPEVCRQLHGIPIEMDRGDLLCFTQMTPHGALPNRSDSVRWSMDIRYEDTDRATEKGRELGFVARSRRDPAAVTPVDDWLAKWAKRPVGSY